MILCILVKRCRADLRDHDLLAFTVQILVRANLMPVHHQSLEYNDCLSSKSGSVKRDDRVNGPFRCFWCERSLNNHCLTGHFIVCRSFLSRFGISVCSFRGTRFRLGYCLIFRSFFGYVLGRVSILCLIGVSSSCLGVLTRIVCGIRDHKRLACLQVVKSGDKDILLTRL